MSDPKLYMIKHCMCYRAEIRMIKYRITQKHPQRNYMSSEADNKQKIV